MSEKNILSFSGLHTSSNGFGSVPDGALVEANNVQIVQKNVLEPRRGREPLALDDLIVNPDQIFYHEGTPIVHGTDGSDKKLAALPTDGTVTFFDGTYEAPDRASGRIKSVSADTRTYFTSSEGAFRMESAASTPVLAGAPQTADIYSVFKTSATNGFLGIGYTCAYRVIFGKEDEAENLILGAPGGRAFGYVDSTDTDSRNMNVIFPIPAEATTDDFYQLYRSVQVEAPIVPEDSLFLVVWKNFTAAEISAGQVTVTDNTPDALLGEPLYTNPTSEGILQANDLPPLANDIALWSERLWYGNTKQAQNLELQLLGVGEGADGGTGLRARDVITIAGETYTALYPVFLVDRQDRQFYISEDTTPSTAIEKTARNLVEAINSNPTNTTVSAYYISGPDDLPGKLLIRANTKTVAEFYATLTVGAQIIEDLTRAANVVTARIGLPTYRHGLAVGDTFTLTATTPDINFPVGTKTVSEVVDEFSFKYVEVGANASISLFAGGYAATRLTPVPSFAWNPELPTSGTSVASDNDAIVHRLYYSKYQEYEAVPTLNYLDVGVKKRAILRIYPLADMLVVFKEDGIYAVSGDTAPWSVRLIDETVKLIAPDTLAKVRGKLLGLTNQGVVAINQNGYDIVSGPIENVFVRLAKPDSEAYASIKRNSFAFSRDTDRLYVLYPISDLGSTHQTAYVYNVLFGCWTTWDGDTHGCAAVNPTTDALYIGRVDDVNTILKERRSLTEQDYYDDTTEAVVDSYDNNPGTGFPTITFDTDVEVLGVVPGALAYTAATSEEYAIVKAVDGDVVTFYGTLPSTDAGETITFFLPFTTTVKFNTVLGGSPNQLKQFSEFKFHWKSKYNYHLDVTTSSDLDPTEQTIELTDSRFDITDSLDWGVWTEPVQDRDLIPAAHQQCTYFHLKLTIQEAQSYWQLNGMSLTYVPGSTATMY